MKFRKANVKGFIKPGACNLYLGLFQSERLLGVLGFSNPAYGNYDVFLKADTTISANKNSVDLLLYVLRSKETQKLLEKKFCRDIATAYSMCFSAHHVISRYRKHAKLETKKPNGKGFDLGYMFQLGGIPSLKAAKAQFMQKHKIK